MKNVHELEIYAPIDGFPDYLVTSHGRVLSLHTYHGSNKIREIKPRINKVNGYLYVDLHNNGNKKTFKVHTLVANSFITNHENKKEINHIDEDKTNNLVSNLEWVSHNENINHGTCKQRIAKSNTGKKHSDETKQKISNALKGSNHPLSKSIIGFKINGCDIKYYKFISDCKTDNFNAGHIVECCRKKRPHHKGYKWYYADEFFNKKE